MDMILLNIKLYDLDIGSQVREMSQKLSGIIFYAPGEYFPPISRDPDEVVFGAINAVGTLAESHTATSYRISPRLDSRYITSREAGWFSWQTNSIIIGEKLKLLAAIEGIDIDAALNIVHAQIF